MRVLPDFQRNSHKRGLFAATSLLLLLATQTIAQSGRRAPKPAQPPVITPETENKQPTTSSARELTRKTSLIVGKELSSKHLLSEDAIFSTIVQRLAEFKNVSVTPVGDLNAARPSSVQKARRNQSSSWSNLTSMSSRAAR